MTLQALLGHSNIQMVTRYAHPTEKHQFEAMKRMQAAGLETEVKNSLNAHSRYGSHYITK